MSGCTQCADIRAMFGWSTDALVRRRWEVLVITDEGCRYEHQTVYACNDQEAAVEAAQMLLRQGSRPMTSFMGEPLDRPQYLVCVVEAGGPLEYGSDCMFMSHQYAIAVDETGLDSGFPEEQLPVFAAHLFECGFVHLVEDGSLDFLTRADYLARLKGSPLLSRLEARH